MKCLIIEDQAPAQRVLRKFIHDAESLQLVETFSDVTRALAYLNSNTVDLIFLDIHLPKMSGMDFLRIKPPGAYVILTTAYSEYALESYEHNVVDYLLKPFSFQRFVQAVDKVDQLVRLQQAPRLSKNNMTEVFIKTGHEHIKLVIDDIRYVKADADYTEIHLNGRKHLSSEPLRFWTSFLNPDKFVQIHKSFIINISKVERVSGNRIFLDINEQLPIGRMYKEGLTSKFFKN